MTLAQKAVKFIQGKVASAMPDFELRGEQIKMLKACASAIEDEDILLAEAGTGTGKTFAYLIPIILSDKRAVVSTKTINLQEQLVRKDLAFLAKLHDFSYSLAKGRGHYLCLRRLHALDTSNLFENRQMQTLLEWATQTTTGDISDAGIRDLELWENVNSDPDTCISKRCQYYPECFYYYARSNWSKSKIIVSNHALTAINAMLSPESKFFDDVDCLVADEAHSLDDALSDVATETVSDWWLNKLMNKLLRFDHKSQSQGLLSKSPHLFNDVQMIKSEINKVFSLLRISFKDRQLIKEPFKLKDTIVDFADKIHAFCDIAYEERLGLDTENEQIELSSVIKKLHGCAETLIAITEFNEGYVHYTDITDKKASLNRVELYPAKFVQNQLLPDYSSCIFTSATLSTGGDFGFVKKLLGLSNCTELSVPSPFDIPSKVTLDIITHIEPNSEQSPKQIAEIIMSEASRADGGILILFTSKKMMQETWNECIATLTDLDVKPMMQGQMQNKDMLEVMRLSKNAVVFGLDSFWEGVDVKGDSLKCLIITKLPFDPPDDPITMARTEDIKKKGANPFMQYSLPRAVLKFKQGFGRLIRSHTDTGRVIICDHRIKTKQYGQNFIYAVLG